MIDCSPGATAISDSTRFNRAAQKRNRLYFEVEDLKAANDELLNTINELQIQISERKEAIAENKRLLAELQSSNASLSLELDCLLDEEERCRLLSTRFKSIPQNERAINRMKMISDEIDAVKNQISFKEKKLIELQIRKKQIAELKKLEATREELVNKEQELSTTLQKLRSKGKIRSTASSAEIDTKTLELDQLNSEIFDLYKNSQRAIEDSYSASKQIVKLKYWITTAKSKLNDYYKRENKMPTLNQMKSTKANQLSEASRNLQQAEEVRSLLEKRKEDIEETNRIMQALIKQMGQNVHPDSAKLVVQLQTIKDQNQSVKKQLKKVKAKSDELEKASQRTQGLMWRKKSSSLKIDIETLEIEKKGLIERKEKLSKLREQNEELQSSTLQKDIDEMNASLDKIEKERSEIQEKKRNLEENVRQIAQILSGKGTSIPPPPYVIL